VQKKIDFKKIFICEKHFTDESFEAGGTAIWKDGQKIILPRKNKRLKKGAVPSIFPV